MTTIINTKLGVSRSGKKRIWLEGGKLSREGINPGAKFNLEFRKNKLVIKLCEDGQYIVSRRNRSGRISPIIDLVRNEIFDIFNDVSSLRVCVRNGVIIISGHQRERYVVERVQRLKRKLNNGDSLSICSLFHGGGILDKAIHEGFLNSGLKSKVEIAVEIEADYLESSLVNNPELWCNDSVVIESAIEHVNVNPRMKVNVDGVVAGIPCTGASKSGRSKNKLEFAESHPAAGPMFYYVLTMIQTLNPSFVILENVPEYSKTASMEVIRAVLSNLGYELYERILDGNEFGVLEKRKRLCVVAISRSVSDKSFLIDEVSSIEQKPECVADILEPVPFDSKRWKAFEYLADKAVRDKAAGKGFMRQLLSGEERYLGCIGRHYSKCRSTEPFIVHPENHKLSRLLTPLEHARAKGIPFSVVKGCSETIAHQILGQSIIFPAFRAVAKNLGNYFLSSTENVVEIIA